MRRNFWSKRFLLGSIRLLCFFLRLAFAADSRLFLRLRWKVRICFGEELFYSGALRFFKFDFGNSVRDCRAKLHPVGKWILQSQKSVFFIIYSQNYLTLYLLKCVFLKQGRCSVDF